MRASSDVLSSIIRRARTLQELLRFSNSLHVRPRCDDSADSRIQNWCEIVAHGDQEEFQRRLEWDELDLHFVHATLSSTCHAEDHAVPSWAHTLTAALQSATPLPREALSDHDFLRRADPIPFEELLVPFIRIARLELKSRVNSLCGLLSTDCHATLARHLLRSLGTLCSQALGLEFQIYRAHAHPTSLFWCGQQDGSRSREQYHKFISIMLEGGLVNFFQEYSVLGRLAATGTEFWESNCAVFLQRLASDIPDISVTFNDDRDLGEVTYVEPGLSDPHQHAQSVMVVGFSNGLKLLYKPKNVNVDQAFFELVAWLNNTGALPELKTLRLLCREDYGWVEYVEHLPCQDGLAALLYYERCGMLLCLSYVLSGEDFHQENIIACGDQPVLLDFEMLLSPKVVQEESSDGNGDASLSCSYRLQNSVLRTGLLPDFTAGQDGRVYDVSGFTGSGGHKTPFRRPIWRFVNTDGMTLDYEHIETRSSANVPVLNGVALVAGDYAEEISRGFARMYDFLVAHKGFLLSVESPFAVFSHQRVRALFRPSQVYAALLRELLQPRLVREGVERSIEMESLYAPLLPAQRKPRHWPIVSAEREALEVLDIPRFATYSDSVNVILSSDQGEHCCFSQSGYERAIARLRELDESDRERHIFLIRTALYASRGGQDGHSVAQSGKPATGWQVFWRSARGVLVNQAVRIAQLLKRNAIYASDGTVTWTELRYVVKEQRWESISIGYDLYSGSSGVALFFAALAKITGSTDYRDMALRTLRAVVNNVGCRGGRERVEDPDIGGGTGTGSIIYALVRSSQLLDEPVLLKDAQLIASRLCPNVIASDNRYDIMFGAAGALLGLLALYDVTSDPAVLKRAEVCGNHLIAKRQVSELGYRGWATVDGRLMTGMLHGASGITYALLRLYGLGSEMAFLRAGEEGMAYEHSVFFHAQRGLVYRDGGQSVPFSWCHGVAGIGLARLGCWAILKSFNNYSYLLDEIEAAVHAIRLSGIQNIDNLCCGNFGCIELLLVAGQELEQSELIGNALIRATASIAKEENDACFVRCSHRPEELYSLGLFQGIAGIGYELLRLAQPEQLPSVLLWG